MHKRTFSTSTPQTSFGTQPSMFGQANTSTPSFSFGGSQPAAAQSTPAFGTQQASSFGQPAATQSSFSFGSTAPSTTPFGAQTATTPKPSFSFGSNTQTNASGFGAQAPSTQAPSSFSFGANTQQTAPGFGAQSTNQPQSSLSFGSITQAANPAFGALNSSNQPSSSFSFGANAQNNTSLFGAQTAQSKPAFSFGSATQNPMANAFGGQPQANNQSSFGGNANIPNQKSELQIWQELALIKAKWDTKSPLCYFKHFFYNMVHPDEVHRYVKPAEIDPALWAEAMRNNPDPSCMVPALAVGFDDVRKRMESQYRQCAIYKSRLEVKGADFLKLCWTVLSYAFDSILQAMTAKLEQLQRKHTLETLTRLAEHKRRHVDLTRRTIQVCNHGHYLKPANYILI
ncbi:hypothetical protein INT43_005132 [Umbelopsis isabellina]|uniref:Nucleoporin Nup54 alpha-helical domain-containing protein n=1 Tax=Mortierella isabellina TaxID=91625 RepID=A0A8H7PGT9_MORIS|nr:hypothetical protein INT43_005132 [Umbelopsis isabellina]